MISSLTLTVSDASGPQADISVLWDRWDGDRPGFQWALDVVADSNGARERVAYGSDLRLGSGSGPDHVKAAATLLAFLGADAERYRRHMGPAPAGEDSYLFGERGAELGYMIEDEIAMAQEELEADSAV